MARSGLARLLVIAVVLAVVALSLAAVRSTDALWSDNDTTTPAAINTGQLKLVAGSGSTSTYEFAALTGTRVLPGQPKQAPLAITNGGDTPLRYRLNAAGPQATSGQVVTVSLAGTVLAAGASCTAELSGVSAFTGFDASNSTVVAFSSWRSLAIGASETWCIRSTLKSVTGPSNVSATYTVLFTFGTEQTR